MSSFWRHARHTCRRVRIRCPGCGCTRRRQRGLQPRGRGRGHAHTPAGTSARRPHALASPGAPQRAAAAHAGGPQDVGEWGPVVDWPVVGVHVALLPNGKVLAYDSIGDHATETYPVQDHTRATLWDPATGTQTPVDVDTGFNIFCSGLAHLPDGRMFMAGGNKDQQLNGIVQTHIFDPVTNLWSLGPNMLGGRWYPTVTPLRQRRDAHHVGPRRHARGSDDRRAACDRSAARRSACRCTRGWTSPRTAGRSTRAPTRRCARLTRPAPAHGRRLDSATRSTATTAATRSTTSARCSSPAAALDEGRAGRRPQRRHAAGLGDRADGLRTAAAQPDGARRRNGPRNGRQLVGRGARRPERRRLRGRAVEPGHRAVADARRRSRSRASTTRPRCCCPTAACFRRAAGSAARATRSATSARTPRSSRRPTCSRPTAPSRRGPRSIPPLRPRATARRWTSRRGTRRRSPRSRSSGSAPSRTRTTWSSATSRSPSPPARRASPPPHRPTPTSRRRASTCSSSSTPTACLPSPAWSASRATRCRR